MHNKKINRLYLTALAVKFFIGIAAVLLTNVGWYKPHHDLLLFSNLNFENIARIFFNSDSGWYQNIAENGYPLTSPLNFAFFPLYPYSIAAIMKISGCSFFVSGFFFNVLILYFVVRYFYLFIIQTGMVESNAYRTVLILLFFPFSLHFYFLYTESLFFALLLACFLFILKKQWWQFAVAAGLIVLTRPNGIILAIPFALYMLETDGKINFQSIKKAFITPSFYVILTMPLVFFLWLCYQYSVTGNFLAFMDAQKRGWDKTWLSPFKVLFQYNNRIDLFISSYCTLLMIIAVVMYKKWKAGYQSLIWINLLMPLAAGSLISMTRYLSVLFPYHMALGNTKWTGKYFNYVIILFALMQLILLKYWLESSRLMY